MYQILKASKDSYLTNKIVKSVRTVSGNVGSAGTLDLFKLYGNVTTGSNSTPLSELSRLLIKFDLDPIRELIADSKIDTNSQSFGCFVKLFDVYGGQPTPNNFTVVLHPLSRSFDEGQGRDIVFYGDHDVCNFMTGSREQGAWLMSGANLGGPATSSVDYITSVNINGSDTSVEKTQHFITGEEDLLIDVTNIISSTLEGDLPDEGFRIALTSSLELNSQSYYVKRFASRTAYDESKHPQLIVKYDDSIQDDSLNLTTDLNSTLFLYNYEFLKLNHLTSASQEVTGTNSVLLRLETAISGGFHYLTFTGSQHTLGVNPVKGIYSASVLIPSSDTVVQSKLEESGSVIFTPIWGSIDGTVAYHTGSKLYVNSSNKGAVNLDSRKRIISITGLNSEYESDEQIVVRVEIFDKLDPQIIAKKLPYKLKGKVIRDVHYRIRNSATNQIIIPFDVTTNSTRVSSDNNGMFFKLITSNLPINQSYVIDIMTYTDTKQIYKSVSPIFRVKQTQT